MIEMIIDSLRAGLVNPNMPQQGTPYIVMLKEKDGDRFLPIFIGQFEAHVIALKLNKEETPRPLTHDVFANTIKMLSAKVDSVEICDLKNETFYAKVNLDTLEGPISIDSRPSDAIALSLTWKGENTVPIYVEDSLLEKAGIPVDREGLSPNIQPNRMSPEAPKDSKTQETTPDELGNLSAYSDFLDSLNNLDDFGEGN